MKKYILEMLAEKQMQIPSQAYLQINEKVAHSLTFWNSLQLILWKRIARGPRELQIS